MTLERAAARTVPKLWGSTDLRPWNEHHGEGAAIGEVWYQRTDPQANESALLLKILFTQQPLSIQVHPNDSYARSIGLAHGKCEAWYILSAVHNAKIALGLRRRVGAEELRASIGSGHVVDLIQWRRVKSGDAILVSAGTVHAMGAGIVAVEIQQRSAATFRLFDFGRGRELHPNDAVAAARAEPAGRQAPGRRLTRERMQLVADQHFVLERIDLPPGSDWELVAPRETWLLVLTGRGWIGALDACTGEAIFLEAESARIRVRASGMQCLVAYVGDRPSTTLLRSLEGEDVGIPKSDQALSFLEPN